LTPFSVTVTWPSAQSRVTAPTGKGGALYPVEAVRVTVLSKGKGPLLQAPEEQLNAHQGSHWSPCRLPLPFKGSPWTGIGVRGKDPPSKAVSPGHCHPWLVAVIALDRSRFPGMETCTPETKQQRWKVSPYCQTSIVLPEQRRGTPVY